MPLLMNNMPLLMNNMPLLMNNMLLLQDLTSEDLCQGTVPRHNSLKATMPWVCWFLWFLNKINDTIMRL